MTTIKLANVKVEQKIGFGFGAAVLAVDVATMTLSGQAGRLRHGFIGVEDLPERLERSRLKNP